MTFLVRYKLDGAEGGDNSSWATEIWGSGLWLSPATVRAWHRDFEMEKEEQGGVTDRWEEGSCDCFGV